MYNRSDRLYNTITATTVNKSDTNHGTPSQYRGNESQVITNAKCGVIEYRVSIYIPNNWDITKIRHGTTYRTTETNKWTKRV